jgi:inosose dehydratase
MISRRKTIKAMTLAAGSLLLPHPHYAKEKTKQAIGVQHYTWLTFYKRENKQWNPADPKAPKALKKAGYNYFEPSFDSPERVKELAFWVKDAGINIKSFYVNSTLHLKDEAEKSIASVLATAKEAKKIGAEIVVTNPTPVAWGSKATKTDEQLKLQAQMLEKLGSELRAIGLVLGYHTHDPEMMRGAREFHHMLVNTSAENVKMCLDTHWIFRGTGDSQLAMFDIVKMYANRIVELHLRQSDNGIWSETFAPGDINYKKLAEYLESRNIFPYLVVEQAVEEGTPHHMGAIEAIGQSKDYVQNIFTS